MIRQIAAGVLVIIACVSLSAQPILSNAAGLKTTGAPVNASASAPPAGAGYACVTVDATHCAWQLVSSGTGTVTSVAATVPPFMAVTGSPITTSGTLAFSFSTQALGLIFASPCSGGGAVTFRALCAADIPNITESQVTNLTTDLNAKAPLASPTFTGVPAAPTPATGDNSTTLSTTAFVKAQGYVTASTAPVTSVNSQTGAVTLTLPANTTSTASNWFSAYNSSTGLFTKSQPACADLSNASAMCSSAAYSSLTGLPQLANTITATTSNWLNSYNAATGNFTKSQPAFSDISGSVAAGQMPALTSDATTSAGAVVVTVKQAHWNETAVTNASSPYAVTATDTVITCDATAGAVTINLPAATGSGRYLTIKKIDSSSNACTPTRAGSDLIDGAASYSLTSQYAASAVVDTASAVWSRTHVNQGAGDWTGTSTANTVSKVNGNTPGVSAVAHQFVTSIDTSARGTLAQPADADLSFTDVTTNNSTTSQHGFLPKLGGGTTNFLRADGTWAAPSSSGANTALSNLASVAINTDLVTGAGTPAKFTATAPAATSAPQAGIGVTLTPSAAVDGTSTHTATAGGGLTVPLGAPVNSGATGIALFKAGSTATGNPFFKLGDSGTNTIVTTTDDGMTTFNLFSGCCNSYPAKFQYQGAGVAQISYQGKVESLATGSNVAFTAGGLFQALANGDTTVRHLIGSGTAPTVSSCGTSPSIVGKDLGARVTIGSTPGTTCTITFGSTYTNAPACWTNDETTSVLTRATSVTTTGFVIAGVFAGGDTVSFGCHSF